MQCATCGAEILQGQRFCRACGTATEAGEAGEAGALQTDFIHLSEEGQTARATQGDTSPVGEQGNLQTSVLTPQQDNEKPGRESYPLARTAPPAPTNPALGEALRHQTNPSLPELPSPSSLAAPDSAYSTTTPAASGSRSVIPVSSSPPRSKGWMIAIGGIALFGLIFLSFLLFGRANRPSRPAAPPAPAPASSPSGETYLSEERALIDEEATVITQKFPLVSPAKFNLINVSGNILIEGIEGAEVQVKVTKTGGTIDERRDIRIVYSTVGGNLTLKTPQMLASHIDVAYEVKLPRNLSQVNIQTLSSAVRVANVDALIDIKTASGAMELAKLVGAIRIETESGDILITQSSGDIGITASKSRVDLQGVNGTVEVNNTAGDTRAVFDSSTLSDSLSFESVSGNIDVRFRSELNAELDANTISGTMDVQGLGVDVKKSPGFSQAAGPVGIGGHPLKIKTVSGNIKVRKS